MAVQTKKVAIPLKQQLSMWLPFCKAKLAEQLRSVLPVILWLIFFQMAFLRLNIAEGGIIAIGMTLVVLGLAFFLEGLLIGIMPLGEIIGIKLPVKASMVTIIVLAFILGVGATYAEPSIGILKASGSFIKPWDAPLLYLLLNRYSWALVICVAGGVGLAVVAGMMRFTYSISLKPFIYVIIPLLLIVSCAGFFDANINYLLGLAWDCGGVTTGPVTVPLVLALGIGICRSVGGEDNGSMGFGVVTLASALPILTVLGFGIYFSLNYGILPPMSYDEFFSPENYEKALFIAGSPEALAALKSQVATGAAATADSFNILAIIRDNFLSAGQAILPLTIFLLLAFFLILRERLPKKDEIICGIFIAILGMGLFNIGMEFGLTKMGNQVGRRLPSSFKAIELTDEIEQVTPFIPQEMVQKSIDANGRVSEFFFQKDGNKYKGIPYNPSHYNKANKTYTYVPEIGPLYGEKEKSLPGFAIVLLFAFVLGLLATLAEPALNALGMKVEELTVGTFKKKTLIFAVASGVGMGLCLGAGKIIWNIPLLYMLLPIYIILVILTKFSDELYVNIAWDSAGVTTGPVTVPLVLAMGLGIGMQMNVPEGFGILTMASACPILTVTLMGLISNYKAKKRLLMEQKAGEL